MYICHSPGTMSHQEQDPEAVFFSGLRSMQRQQDAAADAVGNVQGLEQPPTSTIRSTSIWYPPVMSPASSPPTMEMPPTQPPLSIHGFSFVRFESVDQSGVNVVFRSSLDNPILVWYVLQAAPLSPAAEAAAEAAPAGPAWPSPASRTTPSDSSSDTAGSGIVDSYSPLSHPGLATAQHDAISTTFHDDVGPLDLRMSRDN